MVALAVGMTGCATDSRPPAVHEEVSYHDRNGDGRVDIEKHHYRGWADADWEWRDDDHDGRYEQKVLFGYAVFKTPVDIPVATGVTISPLRSD